MYEIGQTVMIYHDPITREKVEGEAKIVERLMTIGVYEDEPVSHFMVRFPKNRRRYHRTILETDQPDRYGNPPVVTR